MGSLNLDTVLRAMAEAELLVDPWRAFVGLIDWHETKYARPGSWYVLRPTPLFPGHKVQDSIVLHPDSAEQVRALLPFCKTDAERAACLWWYGRNQSKPETHA